MTPKPITTYFRGYKFRSRLEARWAVFFDALNIPFAYELQGYDVLGLPYLPDFKLLDIGFYFEIKATTPAEIEIEKAGNLSITTRNSVFLVEGDPYFPVTHTWGFSEWRKDGPSPKDIANFYDSSNQNFSIYHISEDGYSLYRKCSVLSWTHWVCDWGSFFTPEPGKKECSPQIKAAMLKARQARFEHGEQP